MTTPRKPRLALIVAVLFSLGAASLASACPLCSEQLPDANQTGGANVAKGYAFSIFFMMAAPYCLAATLGGGFYYYTRKRTVGGRQ